MLYTAAVHPDTLSLLKGIMAIDGLQKFNLAGGTALALQLGHRSSFDLDFFGPADTNIEEVIPLLHTNYQFQEMHRTQNILVLDLNDVKVDFVKYNFPLIGKLKVEEGIRLLSLEDIAAMKLDAIKGRGRKRDFYDLYFLLNRFELLFLLELHMKKYQQNTWFLILKSLVYFEDADSDAPVHSLNNEITWEEIKKTMRHHVSKL